VPEQGGKNIGISTVRNRQEENSVVAQFNDPVYRGQFRGQCIAVLDGVFISGPSKPALTEVVGSPEAFVARNSGYLICPIRYPQASPPGPAIRTDPRRDMTFRKPIQIAESAWPP
jgi:hypothetical protein